MKWAAPSAGGPDLRDIHMPSAPSWWPLAPGWWMLVILALIALTAAAWQWRRRRRLLAARRRWLDELDELAARHARDGDDMAFATSLHQLLRRVARRHDDAAATQRGESWRNTLARVPVAPRVLGRLLAMEEAVYRPRAEFDAHATLAAAREWLCTAADARAWKPPMRETGHV